MLVHQRVTIINFRESPFAEKDIRFGPPTKTSGPSGSAPEHLAVGSQGVLCVARSCLMGLSYHK